MICDLLASEIKKIEIENRFDETFNSVPPASAGAKSNSNKNIKSCILS